MNHDETNDEQPDFQPLVFPPRDPDVSKLLEKIRERNAIRCREARIGHPNTGVNLMLIPGEYMFNGRPFDARPCKAVLSCSDPQCARYWLESQFGIEYLIEGDGTVYQVPFSYGEYEEQIFFPDRAEPTGRTVTDLVPMATAEAKCAASQHTWVYHIWNMEVEEWWESRCCSTCAKSESRFKHEAPPWPQEFQLQSGNEYKLGTDDYLVARACRKSNRCGRPECNQWFLYTAYGHAYVTQPSDCRLYRVTRSIIAHDIPEKWDSGFTVKDLRLLDELKQECAETGHDWGRWGLIVRDGWSSRSCKTCGAHESTIADRQWCQLLIDQARENQVFLSENWATRTFDIIEYEGWTPTAADCVEARAHRPPTGINSKLREGTEYVVAGESVTGLPCRKVTGCSDPACERWWLRSRHWVYVVQPDGAILEVRVHPERNALCVGNARPLRASVHDLITVNEARRACELRGHDWRRDPMDYEIENCQSCAERRNRTADSTIHLFAGWTGEP
jgi:hypothetical protein